jgi:hypothetical protein
MSSPSRLDQLRRQRALLQEHVTWLDREIAAEMMTSRPPASPPGSAPSGYRTSLPAGSPPPPAAPASTFGATAAIPAAPAAGAAPVNVDELFDRLRADERKDGGPPSKTGCWVAFAVILLVLIGSAGALILFLYR